MLFLVSLVIRDEKYPIEIFQIYFFELLFTLFFSYFAEEIDLSGLQVDVALRKFQSFFRMPVRTQLLLLIKV